jgi:hypothetical protein
MQARNYVKELDGNDIKKLTASGAKLARMVVAENGGIRKTAAKLNMGVSTITKIANGGDRGVFAFSSWDKFFTALILNTKQSKTAA